MALPVRIGFTEAARRITALDPAITATDEKIVLPNESPGDTLTAEAAFFLTDDGSVEVHCEVMGFYKFASRPTIGS